MLRVRAGGACIPLLLPCRAPSSSCPLWVWWKRGRERSQGCRERKAWEGESRVTPHPAWPISWGRPGGRKCAGPCEEPPVEPALQLSACCTWAMAPPVPAGPRPLGSTVSGPLLGHLPLSAGSLRLGGGCGNMDVPTPAGNLRPLNCAQLGQGPELPVLLPAVVGFGMILTHPWHLQAVALMPVCQGSSWAHAPCAKLPPGISVGWDGLSWGCTGCKRQAGGGWFHVWGVLVPGVRGHTPGLLVPRALWSLPTTAGVQLGDGCCSCTSCSSTQGEGCLAVLVGAGDEL